MTLREIENARRLAFVLEQSLDERTLNFLAHYLNYNREQLVTDVHAMAKLAGQMQTPSER